MKVIISGPASPIQGIGHLYSFFTQGRIKEPVATLNYLIPTYALLNEYDLDKRNVVVGLFFNLDRKLDLTSIKVIEISEHKCHYLTTVTVEPTYRNSIMIWKMHNNYYKLNIYSTNSSQ